MDAPNRFVMQCTGSNMYLYIEKDEALMVDSHPSEDAAELLKYHKVKKISILLTHEHFDHTVGVNWFRERFPVKVFCQQNCAESIKVKKNNRPFVYFPMVEDKTEEEKREILAFYDALPSDAIHADITFNDRYDFLWREHRLHLCSCPGHSMGSTLIFFDDHHVFTGDYMIPDAPVILRFPGGSKDLYRQETLPVLLGLGGDLKILPGHGEPCRRESLEYSRGTFVKH